MSGRVLGAILVGLSTFVGITVVSSSPTTGVLIAIFGGYFAGILSNND